MVMADHTTHSAYVRVYNALLETAADLATLRREGAGDGGVEPHAGAAMHAVRFAAAVLFPAVPCQTPPPFPALPDDTERLLNLAANWRDAALGLGEFAPEPALRLVTGEQGSGPDSASVKAGAGRA